MTSTLRPPSLAPVVLGIAAASLAACDSTEPLPDPIGVYTLERVNGEAPPLVWETEVPGTTMETGTFDYTLDSLRLEILEDSRIYEGWVAYTRTPTDPSSGEDETVVTEAGFTQGFWRQVGREIEFNDHAGEEGAVFRTGALEDGVLEIQGVLPLPSRGDPAGAIYEFRKR